MKLFVYFFISFLILLPRTYANDSTHLYNKRIQKLKELSEFLVKKPIISSERFEFDSTSEISKFYDTAIQIFFNKHLLDSVYLYSEEKNTNITTSHKVEFLKRCIASFHDFSHRKLFDSLKFRASDYDNFHTAPLTMYHFLAVNSITNYYIIDGKEYQSMIFLFQENSTKLIGILAVGHAPVEAKKLEEYEHKL